MFSVREFTSRNQRVQSSELRVEFAKIWSIDAVAVCVERRHAKIGEVEGHQSFSKY